jgi:hypothetical protein
MPLNKTLKKVRNNNATLTSLNLVEKQIRDTGAKDLSDALKHNTTLVSLDLFCNQISAAAKGKTIATASLSDMFRCFAFRK